MSLLFPIALGLSTFAPFIKKWFKGEEGTIVAQKVIDIATTITGEDDISKLATLLKNNDSKAFEFKIALAQLDIELEKAFVKDRQHARERDLALFSDGHPNVRANIMIIAAALGLITCLATLIVYENNLPGEAVGIISTIAGIFGSCLKDSFAFEFGSSRGSKEKDRHVAQAWRDKFYKE